MLYVEAPQEFDGSGSSLFLAGGISGTENWQSTIVAGLSQTDLVLLNPRRSQFCMDDPQAAELQIEWEHRHLQRATYKLFWFPPQTLCPIALYELGAWSRSSDPLFVGVHPDYRRRVDVEIQTRLSRPDVELVYGLQDLLAQVLRYLEMRKSKCKL